MGRAQSPRGKVQGQWRHEAAEFLHDNQLAFRCGGANLFQDAFQTLKTGVEFRQQPAVVEPGRASAFRE